MIRRELSYIEHLEIRRNAVEALSNRVSKRQPPKAAGHILQYTPLNGAVHITGNGRPARLTHVTVHALLALFAREGAERPYADLRRAHASLTTNPSEEQSR